MNITVIGTGYVGLVQGVVLAEFGMQVICVDIDKTKIDMLNKGMIPIYEPGLKEIMDRNVMQKRLTFTTSIDEAVKNAQVIFIAVGTPMQEDGSADLQHVMDVAKQIGSYINSYKVIVNKSTVPVGTGDKVREMIAAQLSARQCDIAFDVVSNPEFLQEGRAVDDCLKPDRVVIGTQSDKAKEIMQKVYANLIKEQIPIIYTDVRSAEVIKYAANAFLAVKISFINEIANLAEKVNANTSDIAYAMGLDARIALGCLQCGAGFGGSCLPKDTRAIVDTAHKNHEALTIVEAAIRVNEMQQQRMVDKVISHMGNVVDKTVTVLGLSFKPNTDDMRDAPSLYIINKLIAGGALIKAYCPSGTKEASYRLAEHKNKISYCVDEYNACEDSNALVIITQWDQFSGLDLYKIKELMRDNYLFDLRNIFVNHEDVRSLFKYFPVGHK